MSRAQVHKDEIAQEGPASQAYPSLEAMLARAAEAGAASAFARITGSPGMVSSSRGVGPATAPAPTEDPYITTMKNLDELRSIIHKLREQRFHYLDQLSTMNPASTEYFHVLGDLATVTVEYLNTVNAFKKFLAGQQ